MHKSLDLLTPFILDALHERPFQEGVEFGPEAFLWVSSSFEERDEVTIKTLFFDIGNLKKK